MDKSKTQIVYFMGLKLQEIEREEFDREDDVFKIQRWKKKDMPCEWYFKVIDKPVLSFKEKYGK